MEMDRQLQEEKREWWCPSSGWLSLFISIISLLLAAYSAIVATGARRDSRAIAALDLRPQIELRTQLVVIGKIPRHFMINNTGPIEAVQIEVQLFTHHYDRGKDRMISGYGTENRHHIDSLKPLKEFRIPSVEHWLDVNARLHEPVQDNIIEIRISYQHPANRQLYRESAFYFVNPEGRWVAEYDNSIANEVYGKLKEALFARHGNVPARYLGADPLHPITD